MPIIKMSRVESKFNGHNIYKKWNDFKCKEERNKDQRTQYCFKNKWNQDLVFWNDKINKPLTKLRK